MRCVALCPGVCSAITTRTGPFDRSLLGNVDHETEGAPVGCRPRSSRYCGLRAEDGSASPARMYGQVRSRGSSTNSFIQRDDGDDSLVTGHTSACTQSRNDRSSRTTIATLERSTAEVLTMPWVCGTADHGTFSKRSEKSTSISRGGASNK